MVTGVVSRGFAMLALAALLSLLAAAGGFAPLASAQPTTTTTVAPSTTTTAPPPTTTTTIPPTTTTTLAPATTTTRTPRSTTTTTHPPTTTTTVAASSTSTPWGWIILAIALVLAALLVAWLIARNRRQDREDVWQRSVGPTVTAAELARDLVLSQTATDDAERRANVAAQVDDAVDGLERAGASAPDETARALCQRCADSLRGLAFAVEADYLMRSGAEPPTGAQLAAADQARRHRMAELDAALRDLKMAVSPPARRSRR
jgi:hypothetical protein